mmetsp:Transcript_35912/g.64224  ORF Transcript_35912/g.64224 Transcript_35912/m.64224 type:complete len:89 (-) Transcript_35912:1678-1944(-)
MTASKLHFTSMLDPWLAWVSPGFTIVAGFQTGKLQKTGLDIQSRIGPIEIAFTPIVGHEILSLAGTISHGPRLCQAHLNWGQQPQERS